MKLGLVIHGDHPETVWNAFRLATFSLKQGDQVRVFLLAKGVESERLEDPRFDAAGEMRGFLDAGGEILACGTCLKIRQQEGGELCPLSTMADLHQLIAESDKVLTF